MQKSPASPNLRIQPLPLDSMGEAMELLEEVFCGEQNIPSELIPIPSETQRWWCLCNDGRVFGTVAAWKEDGEWHWGRLTIHRDLRGKGWGKRLVIRSLNDLFHENVDLIRIDARDATVKMIRQLGGRVTGEKSTFYGHPITPMEIRKADRI